MRIIANINNRADNPVYIILPSGACSKVLLITIPKDIVIKGQHAPIANAIVEGKTDEDMK